MLELTCEGFQNHRDCSAYVALKTSHRLTGTWHSLSMAGATSSLNTPWLQASNISLELLQMQLRCQSSTRYAASTSFILLADCAVMLRCSVATSSQSHALPVTRICPGRGLTHPTNATYAIQNKHDHQASLSTKHRKWDGS